MVSAFTLPTALQTCGGLKVDRKPSAPSLLLPMPCGASRPALGSLAPTPPTVSALPLGPGFLVTHREPQGRLAASGFGVFAVGRASSEIPQDGAAAPILWPACRRGFVPAIPQATGFVTPIYGRVRGSEQASHLPRTTQQWQSQALHAGLSSALLSCGCSAQLAKVPAAWADPTPGPHDNDNPTVYHFIIFSTSVSR